MRANSRTLMSSCVSKYSYSASASSGAATDDMLRQGAEEGMDGFLKVFTDAYLEVIEGELTAERARFKFT